MKQSAGCAFWVSLSSSSSALTSRWRRSISAPAEQRSHSSATAGSVRRSAPMPACCEPWPGKRKATFANRPSPPGADLPTWWGGENLLLGFDHLAAGVVAAVGADRVRSHELLAVRAWLELDVHQREMRTPATLLRLGQLDLRQSHGCRILPELGCRLLGGRFAALIRLGLTRLQRLDTTPHRRQRAPEVRLELFQLLQRIGLGLADDLVRFRLRVLDDLRPMAFGTPQDLVVGRRLLRSLVRTRHDASGLGVRLRDDALLLRHGPVRLLDLVRQVEPKLVDELHDLVLIDHHLGRQRNVACVLDQVLEPVKQLVDLYLNFSFSALATPAGTRSDTFPP